MEFLPRKAGRQDPGRLHVAGLAGRAVRRDHDQRLGSGPAIDSAAPVSGARPQTLQKDLEGNYYVANFKDYRFLQVFYPTRGILAWYSRATGRLQPLPGADDPRYVQTNAVWSPDGKYLVFARAEARASVSRRTGSWRNSPTIPTKPRSNTTSTAFRSTAARAARPEPIAGASRNGMSNSFPKVSPDGRWIVFVQARNGLLMRPDSQLYIVPAQAARRGACSATRR